MTGRTSGEYSKDEPTLRWQMEYVIKTVESINKDLTTLKVSDGVMEERVRNIAERAARDVADAEKNKQRTISIWTLIFSILGSAVASYFVSLLLQSHK
jgi:hypothetical protein